MIDVRLVAGDETMQLNPGAPRVVPSGDVLVAIEGAAGMPVRLDGRIRRGAAVGSQRVLAIDLTRSTGFHHLQIGLSRSYWFGSEDSKLRLDGMADMLRYLRGECTSWSGQLMFSNGVRFLDPHVVYGWLDQHADAALAGAREIASRPFSSTASVAKETARAGKRIDLRASVNLIRRRPKELLLPAPTGIRVGGLTYLPRKVVVRERIRTFDTAANRRVAWLVGQVQRWSAEVGAVVDDSREVERCRAWARDATVVMSSPPFASLARFVRGFDPPPLPTSEESIDARYASNYSIARTLSALGSFDATTELQPLHAYVPYSDVIYQAFVTTALGEALDLVRAGTWVGGLQPAYQSSLLELYGDVVPHPNVIRTWRSYTTRPDYYHPDMLLRDRSTGAILIGDAKYRRDATGAAESGRKDLLAYMAAFGVNSAVMFYPPAESEPLTITDLSAQGHRILEVTVGPRPDLRTFLRGQVTGVLPSMMQSPPWRD